MASLKPQLPAGVRIFPLSDTYPAGDEFILVHDITGKVIPPGGLPKDVGAAVTNVETLVNIGLDRPVTHKYLTVAGAVKTPVTLRVPVGLSLAEAIEAAGGATVAPYAILLGGVMMARLADDPDQPITKTTGGIIVLPTTHPLVRRHGAQWGQIARVGRSACDQCRFCTEMCPRYLLGHPIEPHAAMRALGFTEPPSPTIAGTLYCCECNLCSLYACPEDLDPKSVCVESKPIARETRPGVQGPARGRSGPSAGRRAPSADEAAHGSPRPQRVPERGAPRRLRVRSPTGGPSAEAARRRTRPSPPSDPASACGSEIWSPSRPKASSGPASMPASTAPSAAPTAPWRSNRD